MLLIASGKSFRTLPIFIASSLTASIRKVSWIVPNIFLYKSHLETVKRVRDVIKTYSQMHGPDKYSQHSSVIWSVWLNGWLFLYELSGCGFETRCCSHLSFRFRACFEEGIPWHSGHYRVWIHSETRIRDMIRTYSQLSSMLTTRT